jgi:hypothetical protein
MKLIISLILLSLSLSSYDIPFHANFRTHSEGNTIIYSSRLNLLEFNSSKIISILEQRYSTTKDETSDIISIKYIYYW